MHQICEGGLYTFDQNVDAEIELLLEAVDQQNNQRITYSEIVQLLSQRTVPCYPNNEITVACVTSEARQVPILEKFVQFTPSEVSEDCTNDMLSENASQLHQESISRMMLLQQDPMMLMATDE